MFQNISFSFLCALAFTSWSLLCYLHAIEKQQILSDYNVELYTERPVIPNMPQDCPYQKKSTQPIWTNRIYELLTSYGIVLITTVALSKLLQWLEIQTRIVLLKEHRFEEESMSSIAIEPMKTKELRNGLPQTCRENAELKEQLSDLHTRCKELIQELRAVNSNPGMESAVELSCNSSNSNSSFGGSESTDCYSDSDDNSGAILWKQPTMKSSGLSVRQATSLTQNVYVTHRHLHINVKGNLHPSDNNDNFGALCRKHSGRPSEFLQVWSKYIQGPTERPMIMGLNNVLL